MQRHNATTAYLEAAFDAVLAAEHAEHARRHALPEGVLAQEAAEHPQLYNDTPLDELMCVCGYMDFPPRNLNDQCCDPCEARKAKKAKKDAEEMEALVAAQLALPDAERIFTEAELRDTAHVHCDKRGFNRLLLRAMRKKLGIPLR